MILLPAIEAYQLVKAGDMSAIFQQHLSPNFKWIEVFLKCTPREIEVAPMEIYHNAIYHAGNMEKVRAVWNKPVLIIDWYRGNIVSDRIKGKTLITHDKEAGGTSRGYHPRGLACDFNVKGINPYVVHDTIDPMSFCQKCGLEDVVYNGVHLDSRGKYARFGKNK